MEVSLTIPRDDFDTNAFERCLAVFSEIVERPDDVRITITTDFVAAVREKVSDPDYAAEYEQDRHFAVAIAKTIPQDDGTIDLVVDAGLLSLSAEPGMAERSFEHEAYDVAIRQRDESLSDIRERHGLDRLSAGGIYLSMAGIACEEYRVERTLSRGNPDHREDTHSSGFADTASRLDERIREASRQYENDGDVGPTSRTVMEAVHAVATWTAYVAAECDPGDDPAVDVPADLDARVLGDPWRAVVAELVRVPAADEPTDRADLDRIAMQVAVRLAAWIGHIGFHWEDTDGGGVYAYCADLLRSALHSRGVLEVRRPGLRRPCPHLHRRLKP